MSAKFPNVPNVPGVPPVARPDALLATIRTGSADALNGGTTALGQLTVGNGSGALGSLTGGLLGAESAAGPAEQVFTDGSDVLSGLRGSIANATSAISSLGSGDFSGAIASTERLIDAARRANTAVNTVINPPVIIATTTSDDEVEAELTNQWGLYTQEGQLAAPADTVLAFEIVLDARISDYPVEKGGFASYNKVQVPYEIRAVMTRGGSVENRQDFLKAIQDAWQATTLYNFVTPECVYLDVNVVGVRQQRASDRGNGLMALEVVLRKVRQTATLAFTDTKEPTGEDVVNKGSVQATPTAGAQQYAGAAK